MTIKLGFGDAMVNWGLSTAIYHALAGDPLNHQTI
jgi:hypothetical protein